MTREEAKAYFEECNENLITTSKDENVYDYEKQEIMGVSMRETYEANIWAISALSENKGEWKEEFKGGRKLCSNCGIFNFSKYKNFCPNCGADMRGESE